MERISLRLSEDQQSVEALLAPAAETTPISEAELLSLLAESEFSQCKLLDEGQQALIKAAVQSPDEEAPHSVQIFVVAEKLDSTLELLVSEDQMSCEARITTAQGGQPVNATVFKQALKEAKVSKGIDTSAASELMKKAYRAEPGSEHKAIIANGLPAVDGKNGRWVAEMETTRERIENPKKLDDGSVDMLDFGEIQCVEAGFTLMHREPPTKGTPGFSITGDIWSPTPGTKAPYIAAEGVERAADGGHIVAARPGLPVEIPGGIRVDNVYTVKQIDLATGHIDFDGSVIVTGDVCEMMKVVATGDVMVGGSVQSASIEAGGDLTVRKGVVGRQRAGDDHHFDSEDLTCELIAKGRMQIGFAQYARLEAEQGIYVDKQLMHCLSCSATEVVVGREKDRNSKLIGGTTRACKQVVCGNYGTDAFVPTEIELKPDTSEIDQQIEQLVEDGVQKQQELEQVKEMMQEQARLPKTRENQIAYKQALRESNLAGNAVVALEQQRKNLLEEKKTLLADACMLAHGTIHPNVHVIVGVAQYNHKTQIEHQGGGIQFRSGEVVYDPELKTID